jgi:hypothetical protein
VAVVSGMLPPAARRPIFYGGRRTGYSLWRTRRSSKGRPHQGEKECAKRVARTSVRAGAVFADNSPVPTSYLVEKRDPTGLRRFDVPTIEAAAACMYALGARA